jgi:hypothetical protein
VACSRACRLARDAVAAEAADQQVVGFSVGEQVQGQRHGAVQGDQTGQLVPAGDQDEAAGCAGQQRPHLLGVAGVVQDQQHPTAGQLGAVERELFVRVGRNGLGGHAQCGQESADRGHRRQGCAGGVEAAQVDVQLTVRELLGVLVTPVRGQCGLADASGAADRRDHHQRRAARGVPLGVEVAYLGGAADEVGAGGRKLAWHETQHGGVPRCGLGCRVGAGQGGVVGQHRAVQPLQLRSGVDAQLVGEKFAGLVVGVQCFRAPPGPVQGQHQVRPQPFPQWAFGGQLDQLGDPLGVPAEAQIELDALFQGGQPLLDQTRNDVAVQEVAGHVRQRFAVPQRQRLVQQRCGRLRLAGRRGGAGAADQGAELVYVDPVGVHDQAVSGG